MNIYDFGVSSMEISNKNWGVCMMKSTRSSCETRKIVKKFVVLL